MPPDAARVQQTTLWLEKAVMDLRGADWCLKARPPLLEFALFHAQQAIEKTMKGFLVWHDVPFQKIHDLGKLGKMCCQIDGTLAGLAEKAAPLTEFAVQFRYPEEGEPPTARQAKAGVSLARRLYGEFLERLCEECETFDVKLLEKTQTAKGVPVKTVRKARRRK
jgi:HEPN domain-containing protein